MATIVENTEQRTARVNRLVTKSVDKFNAALDEFARTIAPSELVKLQRRIVIEALRRIVLKTPVDTGRARGNWRVDIGTIDPVTTEMTDKQGAAVIREGIQKLRAIGFGQTVFISNSLDYIVFLEDGSSQQAPNGMVRLTLQELEQIFP